MTDYVGDIKIVVFDVLNDVLEPSKFAFGTSLSVFPNPVLDINGHGTIGLPLSNHDAAVLKSKCSQSPFGKGADTLVDTSVRNSWELNPSEFTIRNPAWDVFIKQLAASVHENLRLTCHHQHVKASSSNSSSNA